MNDLAIIGGTGLATLDSLEITRQQVIDTPYGKPSSPLIHSTFCGKSIVFLARHGIPHTIPPHKINYRANMWAIKTVGIKNIIAVASVGGIHSDMQAGDIVIPHQLIDYTYGRAHTFFEENLERVTHIDFTQPYTELLRQQLLKAANQAELKVHAKAVYGVTQGPRLETTAEIDRMEKDGCDIVGMTSMPETALARELALNYATCAIVANQAAGHGSTQLNMTEIEANLKIGMQHVQKLLAQLYKEIT